MEQDFDQLLEICQRSSELCSAVVDDVLIYYAAERSGVEAQMEKRFKQYRTTFKRLPEGAENQFKAQYLAHLLFRENGIVARYNLHSLTKDWSAAEKKFLNDQVQVPWFFTFCEVTGEPAPDFYQMRDVFHDRSFLLYSPAVTRTLKERPVVMWHTLIGYNGACWQTYGPVTGFSTFDGDDLFFYATEVASKLIYTDEDFLKLVESNPVPFMPLLAYSQSPIVQSDGYEIRYCVTEVEIYNLAVKKLQRDFSLEEKKGVYRLSLNGEAGQPPHDSTLYYDPSQNVMSLNAFTEWGHAQLVKTLGRYGFDLDELAEVCIHPALLTATQEIRQRKLELWPYEDLFEEAVSPEEQEQTDKINRFIADVTEDLNENRTPATTKLAARHDLDEETALDLVQTMKEQMQRIKDKYPRK